MSPTMLALTLMGLVIGCALVVYLCGYGHGAREGHAAGVRLAQRRPCDHTRCLSVLAESVEADLELLVLKFTPPDDRDEALRVLHEAVARRQERVRT